MAAPIGSDIAFSAKALASKKDKICMKDFGKNSTYGPSDPAPLSCWAQNRPPHRQIRIPLQHQTLEDSREACTKKMKFFRELLQQIVI